MKRRPWLVLVAGLLLAGAAYCELYLHGTAPRRALLKGRQPELGWLKQEFGLDDREFARICELHAAYQPRCAEMCRRIEARGQELMLLLNQTNPQPAAIEAKLSEAAALRLECQQAMLRHFVEVSRSMRPEAGRRYLSWVVEKTLLPAQAMSGHHGASAGQTGHEGMPE